MTTEAETTRLSSKGQVVLPSAIRRARNWSAGTEFTVQETSEGVLLKPVRRGPPTRIEDVAGCLRFEGTRKTLKQMEDAIAEEVRQRHARGRY